MSSSVPCNIPYMLSLISKNIFHKIDIKKIDLESMSKKGMSLPHFTILDVGCGYGKWGFLIRDTFEVLMGQNFDKKDWKINITGVEAFDKCITDLQKKIYNKIIKKDIFEALKEVDKFGLIILGDVIEHFEKKEAYRLLNELFKHSNNILISTPLGFMPQGAWAGNEKEIHKSGWNIEDFKDYKIIEHKIITDDFSYEIMKNIPNLPRDLHKGIQLLVLWIRK